MGTHPIFESDFDCLTEFVKMPKSRRDRTIALTRTSKKQGIEHKEKIIEQVRTLCDTYERCFVYSLDNTRNNHLKTLRSEFKNDSRFYQGKNKLTQIAMGKAADNEYKEGLHKIAEQLVGEVGLLFTNRASSEVEDYFNKYNRAAFARADDLACATVLIKKGPLPQFSHAIEAHLREKLKFPTMLNNGVVELLEDVFLSKDGEYTVVNALTAWDKRTYNAITVEGDDQKWEWLEDGKMHELMKKSDKVESMDVEDENDTIASLF